MPTRKTFLGFCAAVSLGALASVSAFSQINIDQLSPASVYDAGVIQDGGLDSALWQGVSAVQATQLIKNIDTNATGSAHSLIRAALLTGGVPPQAGNRIEREAYIGARLSAVLALGNLSDFDNLVNRSDINRANPAYINIFVERALLGGEINNACTITDNVLTARKSPYWAKLRAYCHVVRNEIPAAELTADLLVRSGHEDKVFFALLGKLIGTRPKLKLASIDTPLQIAMLREASRASKIDVKSVPLVYVAMQALDDNQGPADRLAALLKSAHLLSPQHIRSVLANLEDAPLESDKALARKTWNAAIWGGAYLALSGEKNLDNVNMDSRAVLIGSILAQAEKHGQLAPFAQTLKIETESIPAKYQVKFNADIFSRAAVLRGDIASLRGLFQALEETNPLRSRMALATDALNNGFVLGELDRDLERRLEDDREIKSQAMRDVFIAKALGAKLSQNAKTVLNKAKLKGRTLKTDELQALRAAARRGSRAEIALRAAHMIDGEPLRADAFAALLGILASAGMYEQAGRLAAIDILHAQ